MLIGQKMNMQYAILCRLFLIVLLHAPNAAATQYMRTWVDSSGKKMNARLISTDGSTIVLEREDGRRFSVDYSRFSVGDQRYLRAVGSPALRHASTKPERSALQPRAPVYSSPNIAAYGHSMGGLHNSAGLYAQSMGGLYDVEVYRTKTASSAGNTLKLANGAIVELAGYHFGINMPGSESLLIKRFGEWSIWTDIDAEFFECNVLIQPRQVSEKAKILSIQSISADGSLLIMEDDTIYKVDEFDRFEVSMWLPMTEVLILSNGQLINMDDGGGFIRVESFR
jgi:hypothetical protein